MNDQEEQPYNPLDRTRLGASIVAALLEQPCFALPPEPFRGVGIYALYYQGDFAPYQPISSEECATPIYVGKAEPQGRRTGLPSTRRAIGHRLFNRLGKHANSIASATNLGLEDFRCKYLLVEDLWIPLGETLLIARFRPLWNVAVEGFGINDPGGGRYGSDRSDWDEIHPGRPWRDKMVQKHEPEDILADIQTHLGEGAD